MKMFYQEPSQVFKLYILIEAERLPKGQGQDLDELLTKMVALITSLEFESSNNKVILRRQIDATTLGLL